MGCIFDEYMASVKSIPYKTNNNHFIPELT
jgi:hypothetical protein